MSTDNYLTVTEKSDVTEEILDAAVEIYRGHHTNDGKNIRWGDLLDRLDGALLDNGQRLDLGNSLVSPAIKRIKAHVSAYRRDAED